MVHKNGIKALVLVVLSLLAAACANRGLGPQGGPEAGPQGPQPDYGNNGPDEQ